MDYLMEQYILEHSDKEPAILQELERETKATLLNGRMVSGHLQGRLLVLLCRLLQPRSILELGTFTGYATICLAEGSGEQTIIHTVEHNDELADTIHYWINRSGFQSKIKLHLGEAIDIIQDLTETFDLVYLDLDKRDYLACYEAVLPKLRAGGVILADNTLWGGKILEKIKPNDTQSLAISKFNDYIAYDSRVEKVLLPLRDGLTLIRKK